jgi:hypothetical protein
MHPMCDDIVAVGDTRVCKEYPIEIKTMKVMEVMKVMKVMKVIDGKRIVFLSGSVGL